MNAKEAIKNLEYTSRVFEDFANRPENYNKPYASYLEVMSWEMHKQANELKNLVETYGGW